MGRLLRPDLTTNDATKVDGVGAVQYCTITSLDESPVEQGILWASTDDGNVWVTRDEGETWSNLADRIPQDPGYWVSRVEASHHEAGSAYVTYTGLHQDDLRPYVYKTTDFGDTWNPVINGLPRASVNVIVEDRMNPNLLFVGTDTGVFVSLDGGESWNDFRNDMPVIPVHDLLIHPRENDLVVGTHGRGFFITDVSPLQELTARLQHSDMFLFAVEPKVQWVMPSQPAVSSQNFEGDNEPYGVVINYYFGAGTAEGAAVNIRILDGTRVINEIEGPGERGLNRVEWGMTQRRERTEREKARWDRMQKYLAEDEEFFDYYDTVEYFLEQDEEVDKWGRSLRTRVHQGPGLTDREYIYSRVPPGEYVVELEVGHQVLQRSVIILQDYWYDK